MKGKNILFALGGGVILALSFPSANIAFLSLFGVSLLLLALSETEKLKEAFLLGLIWGVAFFGGLVYWVVGTVHTYGKLPLVIAVLAYFLLVAYLALYPALFALFVGWLKKGFDFEERHDRLLLTLLLPSAWVLLEQLRGTFPFGGFPWGDVGYAWVSQLEWVQIAEFTSVSGVSFLVLLINVLFFFGAASFISSRMNRRDGTLFFVAGLLLLAGNHFFGTALMTHESERQGESSVKVGLLQGNIDQDVKWDKKFVDQTLKTYFRLQYLGVMQGAELIVWPETSVPFYLLKNPNVLSLFHEVADEEKINLIVGAPDYLETPNSVGYPVTNTAFFFRSGENHLERYDKSHLVPFGEYVPMQKWLPFIDKLVEEVGNFAAGSGSTLFQNGSYSIAPFICFEVIFPEEVRKGVQKGANLITHITNDAWFGDSSAPYQHVEIVQMRSIENRVPSITAANTGVTNVILPTGEIVAQTKLLTEDVLVHEVKLRSFKSTFYGENGPLILYLCFLIVGVGTLQGSRKLYKKN